MEFVTCFHYAETLLAAIHRVPDLGGMGLVFAPVDSCGVHIAHPAADRPCRPCLPDVTKPIQEIPVLALAHLMVPI